MPITVYEKHGSPDGRFVNPVDGAGSSFTYTYVVMGTDNVTTATGAVAAAAPLVYLADDSQVLVRQEFIPKVTGPSSWEIGVRYGTEDDRKSHEVPEAGFWRFSFDTTGGTHKITQSLETIHRVEADPADPAPDLKQAIGWDGKRVNGVDVVVPKLEFDITAYYAPATITAGYMKDLARKTGRTNDGAWLGFDEGEILYMGSTGDGDVPLASGPRVTWTQKPYTDTSSSTPAVTYRAGIIFASASGARQMVRLMPTAANVFSSARRPNTRPRR